MTFAAGLARALAYGVVFLIHGVLLIALAVIGCFFVGWCLGWVILGIRAVAGC